MKASTRALTIAALLGPAVLSSGCGGRTEVLIDGVTSAGDSSAIVGSGANSGAGADKGSGSGAGSSAGSGLSSAGGAGAGVGIGTGGDDGGIHCVSNCPPLPCTPGVPASSQIPRLLNREYDSVVKDLLGVESVEGRLPSDLLAKDFLGPMTSPDWNAYLQVGSKIAAEVMTGPGRERFLACDPAEEGCFEETIRSFGRRAYRRPVSEEEVERLMAITTVQPQGTPEEAAEGILVAFLVSPSFLLRPEVNMVEEDDLLVLSSYEVAARLSFMLWGSIPDDLLSAAADAGLLQTKEQILDQASRMIQDRQKAGRQVVAAHRAYLGSDSDASHWWKVQLDTEIYPNFSEAAATAMKAELDAFFEDVAFSGGTFADLFLSNVAFVNQDTAAIYGLEASDFDGELRRVELDSARRPGFLTRAGFLYSFSNYQATSPILRGTFLTVNIIGVDPGVPDPDQARGSFPAATFLTRREEVEALTEQQPQCAGCHEAYINPPGFVLENYDAIGAWQEVDRLGGDIDSTAQVVFSENNIKLITSPLELMEEIANNPRSRPIYIEEIISFSTGRNRNEDDSCLAKELDLNFSIDGYTLLDLLLDLTQADSFRLRSVEK